MLCKKPAQLIFLSVCLLILSGCHSFKPLPSGLSFSGIEHGTDDLAFFSDRTWVDEHGVRRVEQHVFDEMFSLIDGARRVIVIDMFLFNDWQGSRGETTRALSGELTESLLRARKVSESMQVVVITDPVNTLYGGLHAEHLALLEANGIIVVETDLDRLRDSNFLYSPIWRLLFKPFGNSEGFLLPNPIGPGRVSFRTYLKLLNFKANHRKTLIVDQGSQLVGFVSSANPHDASSAHRNVALRFTGPAVKDLLDSENAVLSLSGFESVYADGFETHNDAKIDSQVTVQVVTERKIEEVALQTIRATGRGDQIDLMMFYLSDKHVVEALIGAQKRGVSLRVLLDPNKDAFGREKNGIPNRQAAYKLSRNDIEVRWCASHGEQCHSKMMLVSSGETTTLVSGSANFTRRNLDNYNLETDVVVRGASIEPALKSAHSYFEESWSNDLHRLSSVDYEVYQDHSPLRRLIGWVMETGGIGTF